MIDNMNSSRPLFDNKKEISENELKTKEFNDKLEKLEKELLKLQIQNKSLEDRLKIKNQKEYITNVDTSSNFILPSEFKKLWENIAKDNIPDCFIDFSNDPVLTFILIQKLFEICIHTFSDELKEKLMFIMESLNITNEKNNYLVVFNLIKPLLMEYYSYIFESENVIDDFIKIIKEKYTLFIQNLNFFKKDLEYNELITSTSFFNLVKILKKIIIYSEFHDPSLIIRLNINNLEQVELKYFFSSDCMCIDGLIKENKLYIVLLNPPLLKNNYVYQGFKPIVMNCNMTKEELYKNLTETLNLKEICLTTTSLSNNNYNKIDKILNYTDRIYENTEYRKNKNQNPAKLFNITSKNDMVKTKVTEKYNSSPKKINITRNTIESDLESKVLNQRSISQQNLIEKTFNQFATDIKENMKREKLVQSSRYESDDSNINVGTELAFSECTRDKIENSIYNSFTNNQNITKMSKLYSDKKTNHHSSERECHPKNSNSYNVSNNGRNKSKTPKIQNKSQAVGYSPRSGNDKLISIKDKRSRENSIDKYLDDKNSKFRNNPVGLIIKDVKYKDKNLKPPEQNKEMNRKENSLGKIMENKTNAQTKVCIEDLLSFKKNKFVPEKNKVLLSYKTSKSNFNIKQV